MNDLTTIFPTPAIPLTPVLSKLPLNKKVRGKHTTASLLDAQSILHISSGRAGIALALECAKVTNADEVMIPAYHTDSMIAPVRRTGASPVFYRVKSDTDIDLADIQNKITPDTKVVLVTHYFGFMQNLIPLRKLCDTHNLILIEDCAHTFFGSLNEIAVGQIGDYAIASSMKFFPIYDGGLLVSRQHSLDGITLHSPPLTFQIKAALNILENSLKYQRFGLFGKILGGLLFIKSILWQAKKSISNNKRSSADIGPASADGGYGLDEHWIHKFVSWPSNKIIARTDSQELVRKRRENYKEIVTALIGLPGCRPLHPMLPDGAVPMVCPIYVDNPQKHFTKLKLLGVPIWRFGEYLDPEIDETLCKNSVELSAHIFQFPCHQELLSDELDWMIQTIKTQFEQ
ncbi:MAG: DegT/DnrJ/EryC1/StrS aminotransferase family protein [Pseudomonadales bacterium]|nr:DegT/DnrJ/EryC1/StrS aminotransferase family protein [Pseudomonadales bacterium]